MVILDRDVYASLQMWRHFSDRYTFVALAVKYHKPLWVQAPHAVSIGNGLDA